MEMRLRPALLACLALFACFGCSGSSRDQDAAGQVQVLVVPIKDVIAVPTVALVRRAIREARSTGIARVVLEINTPGGRLDSMREVEAMLAALRDSQVETVAYVEPGGEALSAGAYIALACGRTFMGPGTEIGAITPVIATPGGIAEIPDDDARAKLYAAMRADVRSLLERRGSQDSPYSPDALRIVEAMVDPGLRLYKVEYTEDGMTKDAVLEAEELRDWENRGVQILGRQSVGASSPVVLTAREAEEWGLASGVSASLRELVRDQFGLTMDSVAEMEMSWSETAVEWIDSLKYMLFLFGFILLMVELKTPGFAVPGIAGVLLLGLGMFGSYLVGLAEIGEILLFFLGLGLIGVEIFVMPGVIVFGALGFISLVGALILSQQTFVLPSTMTEEDILFTNLLNMLLLIILVIVAAAVLRRFLPHIPILNRVILEPPDWRMTGESTRFADGERGERLQALVGRVGTAATTLRPAGILELDGDRMDVVTQGGFIEEGTSIRVLRIDGNRIVVEEAGGAGGADA